MVNKFDKYSDGNYQRAVDMFIDKHIMYCVSSLVSELCQVGTYIDDLIAVQVQYDYQSAAEEEGWTKEGVQGIYTHPDKKGEKHIFESWEDLCHEFDIEPHSNGAYEHWIVSNWLADKLEEKGEMILRDFLGLTIWGRTCTGQSISLDRVITDIAKLNNI
jgi:hypothetical protein